MKYLALILSLAGLGLVGCQQTPQIPEQFEPAFASDDFGAEVESTVQNGVSDVKSSFQDTMSSAKSAMQDKVSSMADGVADGVNEFVDATADQFEPMDK